MERERQLTTTRTNQTTGLTNGRTATWAPEVASSPFRALSRRSLIFRWEDSLVSCVDGIPDGRPIHVKNICKCAFKNIRILCGRGFSRLSIYKYVQIHFVFLISFILKFGKFRSLNLHEKAKFWRILKRAVCTMASFYYIRFLQGFAFLRKLGLLFFKPQWDYQI